jgi:aminopeptidase-like protein
MKIDSATVGAQLFELICRLYPICRSITGEGVRKTLRILQEMMPLEIHEVPTGTRVFDWEVPKEWNINDAFIKDSSGRKIIDFANSNLHVVSYSVPFRGKLKLEELKKHLFTLPDHPDWIPYRTSYYNESWGFCLSHRQLLSLADDEYEICIDSSLEEGSLSYGEYVIPGATNKEILLTTHICHPSLCNDNLSGIALVTWLAKQLGLKPNRYTYRFLFLPGTIGSIAWLALNEGQVPLIEHGFVVAGVGDRGLFTYKKSRRGNAEIDAVFDYVLKSTAGNSEIIEFSPYGYDERQFCSPGFNLPVACVMRTPHGKYPEYHTSADNLEFLSTDSLVDSIEKCTSVLEILESNRTYLNRNPKCEPQLGKRGIYSQIGGEKDGKLQELAMLWVLNFSDGKNSLFDVAEKSNLEFAVIQNAAQTLLEHGLLNELPESRT